MAYQTGCDYIGSACWELENIGRIRQYYEMIMPLRLIAIKAVEVHSRFS